MYKAASTAPGSVECSGFVTTTTNGALTGTTSGDGWSVARTGTGTYRITLASKFVSLKSAIVHLGKATATADSAHCKAHDVTAATPYVDFITQSSGSAADISGVTLHFTLHLLNSNVG